MAELRSLRGKNASVIESMRHRVEQEQREFDLSTAKIQAVRAVHLKLLRDVFQQLGAKALKAELAELAQTLQQKGLKLGVKKIVMMSGCPAGAPGDKTPNWITSTVSWPDYMAPALEYQWNEVAIPWWKAFVAHCKAHGVEQIAIEEFPCMLVYNPETLWKLRNAVDPIVGINLDPSHLMAMGADPIASARALKGAIFHIHGKEARIERGLADVNGLLETRPVTDSANRTWNYVAVGCGKDLQWWKEFFSVVRMSGYDEAVSLEMEDLTLSMLDGHLASLHVLREALNIE